MLEFKSPEDLSKLSPDDPVFPIVEDLVKRLIIDYIAEGYEYIPADDGWIVVIEPHDKDRVGSVCLFLLSTGARLNEALAARWEHFDLEHRNWTIPAEHSKSRKIRSIPLNPTAIQLLESLGTRGKYDHPFIGRRGRPMTTIHKVWTRLRADAGLPHLRIHDLRHQYASFLINQGHTLYEVQQILGHSDPSVTQRYAHLSTRSLQAAANSASDAIKGATTGSP